MAQGGEFDRRILVLQQNVTQDSDYGSELRTWSTHAELWAQYKPERAREAFRAGREMGTQFATFIVRYRTDLKLTMRILFDGAMWNIRSLVEIGRHKLIEIMAERELDTSDHVQTTIASIELVASGHAITGETT